MINPDSQPRSHFCLITDEEIKCVKCTCGGNSKSGLKKGNSGFFGGIKDTIKETVGFTGFTGLVKGVLSK